MYHRSETSGEIECIRCIISDDQDHNGTAIHKFIEVIMSFLKAKILVKHMHYFSDGAANIKTIKIFVICASMLLTIKSLLLGIFLLPVMAKAHEMASVVHKVFSGTCQPASN